MKNYDRYSVGYFPPATPHNEWVKKDHVEKAPTWCSVDLRDGNQALIVPMSLEEKVEFFQYLGKTGIQGNRSRISGSFGNGISFPEKTG